MSSYILIMLYKVFSILSFVCIYFGIFYYFIFLQIFNFDVLNLLHLSLLFKLNFRGIFGLSLILLLTLSIPVFLIIMYFLIKNKFFDKKEVKIELKDNVAENYVKTDDIIINNDIPSELKPLFIMSKKYNQDLAFKNFSFESRQNVTQTNKEIINTKSSIPNPFDDDVPVFKDL